MDNKRIRTAVYCRVSTDKEAQDGSFEMQESHFRDLIQSTPGAEFVGTYGDKGKSGLHISGRPGLKKLMEDCRAGKIEILSCKLIQCFPNHNRQPPWNQALWKVA